MPATSVKNGLYWSDHSQTYHFEFRQNGKKRNGDTGQCRIGPAREFLATLKAEAAHEKAGILPVKVPTLEQALKKWAEAERGSLTDKHIKDRLVRVRMHCKSVLGLPLNLLTTEKMDALRAAYLAGEWQGEGWAKARHRTPGGWNVVRRHVFAIINWCIDRGLLVARPFKSKPIKIQEKLRPTLWPEDAARFLASVNATTKSQDIQTAIRLMLHLGLRENEALGAVWEGFDARQGVYRPPKAKNREVREIALPPGFLDHLRSVHGDGRQGLIIPGAYGPHPPAYTKRAIARAGEAIGIVGLHPHALRATFATAHWEAGTSLAQITAMLGHKEPSTSMKYIRQRPLDASKAQAKVAEAMGVAYAVPQQSPRDSTKRKKR